MATLHKLTTTRHIGPDGQQVPKGTPGAKLTRVDSKKWYGCYREGGKQVRIPLSTDKATAQKMLSDLLTEKERGNAGLTDPHKLHLDRPLNDHVQDYLATVRTTASSPEYHRDVARVLNLFAKNGKAKTLREVTADRVATYLSKMTCGPTSRNYYRRLIVGFLNWCEATKKIDRNPITRFTVKTAKKGAKRQRRAMTAAELSTLLEAVRNYPITSAMRGGRPSKQTGQKKPPRLKPATLASLTARGRERHLIYRVAILTGLRRGELSRLKVSHIDLARLPFARLTLPADLTKSGKTARILLVPSLASDLREWIADTARKPSDKVFKMPGAIQMSKLHRKHMDAAGIPSEVDDKHADFHSLRMAANVMLRHAGIPPKERQLFMRHATLALTTETYDDDDATDLTAVVKALEATNL